MPTLEEIRARENDPAVWATSKALADMIHARVDHDAQLRMAAQARKAKSSTAKIHWMRSLAAELAKAADGVVACKSGCNHCCKMATMVSLQEAHLIAKETGLKLHMPKEFNNFRAMRQRYEGVPCTLLKDGKCSAYSARPFACRIHYVVDTENTLCEIHPGVHIRAPHLNVNEYDTLYVEAMTEGGDPLKMQYADIRDFFPHTK